MTMTAPEARPVTGPQPGVPGSADGPPVPGLDPASLTPDQMGQLFPDLAEPGGEPIPLPTQDPGTYSSDELPPLTPSQHARVYGPHHGDPGTYSSSELPPLTRAQHAKIYGSSADSSSTATPASPGWKPFDPRKAAPGPLPGPAAAPAKAPDRSPTPGKSHEAEAVYTDIELLGKSHRVKMAIENKAVKQIGRWERLKAGLGNALDRPGEGRLNRRLAKAQRALDAKRAHQQRAKSRFIQERRQGAVDKAQRKLDERQTAVEERRARIEGRTQTAKDRIEARKQRRIDTIQALRERRESAVARKTLRRELHNDSASKWKLEARQILDEKVTPEAMQRVGHLILVAEASRRRLARAEYDEAAAKGAVHATKMGIAEALHSVQVLQAELDAAPTKIRNYRTQLGTANRHQAGLEARFRAMHEPGPEDEADYIQQYTNLQTEVQQAQTESQRLEAWVAHEQDIIDNNPQRLQMTSARRQRLETEVLPVQNQRAEAARQRAEAHRNWQGQHASERDTVIKDTLQMNPPKAKTRRKK